MTASPANPQPSHRTRPVLVALRVLLSAVILPFLTPAQAQSAYIDVPIPNGNLNISATDLSQQTTAGALNFRREWNGSEWKFQPNWGSLSQSWTNLTGSQTADTTRPTVLGESHAEIWCRYDS